MSRKKTRPDKKLETKSSSREIRVGNIANNSGEVNIAGGNITTHHTTTGLSAAEIGQLFDQLYRMVETRPETPLAKKEDLKAEINEIQSEVTETVQENKKVDEGFLSRRFRNIARMAPDMLDVIVATLGNPLAGLGIAVKKIAEKAREEAK